MIAVVQSLKVQSLKSLRRLRDYIFESMPIENRIWEIHSLYDVKRVVIIASASRSGSSLLFDTLKRFPNIYSLTGESVPFFKLNEFVTEASPSDAISRNYTTETIRNLSRDLLSDLAIWSRYQRVYDHTMTAKYITDLILRFSLQWPQIDLDYIRFKELALETLENHMNMYGEFMVEDYYLVLLTKLRAYYTDINPYYYDIPSEKIKHYFPELEKPIGPPSAKLIEEPPFILVHPNQSVSATDLENKMLLIKDPVNSYRFEFLKQIFPNADVKIIHLTRNPAASINGLYDGWNHRGFFSTNLKGYELVHGDINSIELNIEGYSNKYEWGKWWWNFDRPPSWEKYTSARLEEVCAFQWRANHEAILDYVENRNLKVCRIRFEDFIKNSYSRKHQLMRISRFLGIEDESKETLNVDRLPVVQATVAPKPMRWRSREKIILPAVYNRDVVTTCLRLGYDLKTIGEWV